MNMKKTLLAVGFALLLALALPLRAQTGCEDSPEDPTIVLACIAAAGAVGARLRAVRRGRLNPRGVNSLESNNKKQDAGETLTAPPATRI